MTMPIGTIATVFGNTYIRTDPQYISDLPLWRVIIAPPQQGSITGLGAILPIQTSPQADKANIKISFNIKALNTTPLSQSGEALASKLLQQPASTLPALTQGSTVNTIAPVQHLLSGQNKAILYFDIQSLEKQVIGSEGKMFYSYDGSKKSTVTVKDYNGSNGVSIDSELPMVDQVVGSTATFSFNITQLPKV